MFSLILTLALIGGQLIKLPVLNLGVTILDITIFIVCLAGLLEIRFKLTPPPLFIKAALIFILITITSLVISPLNLDLTQKLASLAYIVRFSSFILLGWLISSRALADLKKDLPLILISSGVTFAILGLLQLIFLPDLRFLTKDGWDPHYLRTVSTLLDPNFLGAYLCLTLLLLIDNPQKKWMLTVVYLALLTTFSRGSYLMFGVSFLTLALINKSVKLGVITILLSLGLTLGFNIYQQQVAAPRNIDRTQSAEYRLDSWQMGLKLFLDHPILGVGFNSYKYALKQYDLASEQFLASRGASSNDSSLLFVLATTGTVGFASYLFFLLSIIWTGVKTKNNILVAGLTGLIVQSFFANTLFYPFLLIWIILLIPLNPTRE